MQPIIITSDKTSWSLRPQGHLLRKYWPGARFTIGGYTRPGFDLCGDFYHIGKFDDYPVNRWSNGLRAFLEALHDDLILFMMDDYWPIAPAHQAAIGLIEAHMLEYPDIARFDLTGDRLGAAGWSDYGRVGYLDVIQSDPHSQYHFSYQAAIWRRTALLECVAPDETPWESEIRGDQRLRAMGLLVLGTKQPPLRYLIAVQHGQLALDGGYQGTDYALPAADRDFILDQKWIPEHVIRN